jgi:hypothetical protein
MGRPGLPTTIRSGSPNVTASMPGWIGPFTLWLMPLAAVAREATTASAEEP